MSAAVALAASAAIAMMTLVAEFHRPLNWDVAWLLYGAQQVLHGRRLMVDFVEINPPLAIWTLVPAAWLADILRVPTSAVVRVGLALGLAGSAALTGVLVQRMYSEEARLRLAWLGAVLVVVLLPWSRAYYGEREHIALALTLPFAAIVAMRARGIAVPRATSVLVAAAAGLGFALKPHFILVWLALIGYRFAKAPRALRPVELADAVVGGIFLAYVAAVLVLVPEYLPTVRQLGPLYLAIARKPLDVLLFDRFESLFAVTVLLGYGLVRRGHRWVELGDVLAVMMIGYLAAMLLQQKGFGYHYYPIGGCALLLAAVGALGASASGPRFVPVTRVLLGGAVAAVATAVCVWQGAGLRSAPAAYGTFEQQVEFLRARKDARSLLRLTYEDSFPLVTASGLAWTMRYPHLWFLQAIYADELAGATRPRFRSPAEMSDLERHLFDSVVADFLAGRPGILMVPIPATGAGAGVRRFDYLAYFSQNPAFAQALAAYVREPEAFGYYVYRRRHSPT